MIKTKIFLCEDEMKENHVNISKIILKKRKEKKTKRQTAKNLVAKKN